MDLEVDRSDLHRVRAVVRSPIALEPGAARVRIDSFGLTSNNITYAVFGDAMGYWQFFPATAEGGVSWGRVPVWGFGEVVESAAGELPEGTRIYGYFPMASELVVRPGRMDESGFTDMTEHRQALPTVYNRYAFTQGDPVYHPDREAQQMLLWPLFVTSFVVDDFLVDHALFGAQQVVISSASAKTSIAAAFLLAEREGLEVVGLTSAGNLGFVEGLGCYDRAVSYDDIGTLAVGAACYVDVAGQPGVTAAVHEHFGTTLHYSMVVGQTHWDSQDRPRGPLGGPKPVFLFAPDQIAKRRKDWGRDGFTDLVSTAWNRFAPWTDGWLNVRHTSGAAGVEEVYRQLLAGRIDPQAGDVCALTEEV